MELKKFIEKKYKGDKKRFAESQGVVVQQVDKWLRGHFIVVDGALYSHRRDLHS